MDDNCATSYERRKSIFPRFSAYWMLKIPTLPWLKFNSTFLIDETSFARGHKVEEQTEKLSKLFSSGNNNSRFYGWTLLRGYNLIWAKNKKQGGWSREKFLIKWKLIIFKEFENWSGLAAWASQPSFSWRIKNRTSYCGFVLKKIRQCSIDSPRLLFSLGKTSRSEVGTWKSVRSLFEVERLSFHRWKPRKWVSITLLEASRVLINFQLYWKEIMRAHWAAWSWILFNDWGINILLLQSKTPTFFVSKLPRFLKIDSTSINHWHHWKSISGTKGKAICMIKNISVWNGFRLIIVS